MHKCMGCGSGWGTVVAQQTDIWANQDETSMSLSYLPLARFTILQCILHALNVEVTSIHCTLYML